MIELNCKVVKKVATPHFYINPSPFSGLSPLSGKKFPTPQVTQFLKVPTPPPPTPPTPLLKGGGGSKYEVSKVSQSVSQ